MVAIRPNQAERFKHMSALKNLITRDVYTLRIENFISEEQDVDVHLEAELLRLLLDLLRLQRLQRRKLLARGVRRLGGGRPVVPTTLGRCVVRRREKA